MCGILGIYFKDETRKVEERVIKNMCETIRHRGPDDEGYLLYGNIGLGVRRLSIIDLATGHQPIHNEDKTVWVVFNGEVYNFPELREELIKKGHIFYTDSDTEIIVHLYEDKKESCPNELNGMFALVILDSKEKKLFIARDRLGVKPLYYYNNDKVFIFASELKTILNFPGFDKQIDPESLHHFFSLNYVPSPGTIFRNIKQLLPGHSLTVTKDDLKITQYWDIRCNGYINDDEATITERILDLLKKSVKRMLRSDVPLGAFLSGGMDSTALVSLMAEFSSEPIKTFSAEFKENSYNETYFAQLASRRFRTEHHQLLCRPNDVIQALPKIVWHADNLLADPAMLPLYLISKLAKEHVTVCLSGDGGDEIFAGYPTYMADRYAKFYRKIPTFAKKLIIRKLINSLPVSSQKFSFEYKAKKFIEGADFSPGKAHYWWRTVFSDNEKEQLFSNDFVREIRNPDSYFTYQSHYNNFSHKDFNLDKYMYADIKVWLTDNNLIRVDAMSMANSLEVRVPFLDHELVEFMFKVPANLRMKRGKLKYLLKRAMNDKIPHQIIERQKAGWHVPLAEWFQTDLKDYISDTLSNTKVIESGFFNKTYIDTLLGEHFRRQRNNSFKIWGLLVFFQWYDTFIQL